MIPNLTEDALGLLKTRVANVETLVLALGVNQDPGRLVDLEAVARRVRASPGQKAKTIKHPGPVAALPRDPDHDQTLEK